MAITKVSEFGDTAAAATGRMGGTYSSWYSPNNARYEDGFYCYTIYSGVVSRITVGFYWGGALRYELTGSILAKDGSYKWDAGTSPTTLPTYDQINNSGFGVGCYFSQNGVNKTNDLWVSNFGFSIPDETIVSLKAFFKYKYTSTYIYVDAIKVVVEYGSESKTRNFCVMIG